MGKPNSLHYRNGENSKQITIENIEKTYLTLAKNGNMFMNEDFRNVIKKIRDKYYYGLIKNHSNLGYSVDIPSTL